MAAMPQSTQQPTASGAGLHVELPASEQSQLSGALLTGGPMTGAPPSDAPPIETPPPVTQDSAAENPLDGETAELPPSISLQPELSFFQQPWVQNVLPFATSVTLHLAIVIVGLSAFKVVDRVTQASKEQMIVPDAMMVNDAPVGGIQNPGLGSDPTRASAQDKVEVAESNSFSDKKTESLSQSLMGGSPTDSTTDNVIGLGRQANVNTGMGNSAGGSGDSGAQLAPFGVPGGGGSLGPKSPFMGISGNAHTVVYVCDASGSMLTKMAQLKEQLRASVSKLQVVQSFSVIFFADPDTKPVSLSTSLVVANPDNKLKFEKYLTDVRAAGSTDPIPGLELAFKMHPQLIYLLTDGDFEDNKKVLDKIKQLQSQANPKVKINTIVFTDPAKADKGIVELMQKIADDSGGKPIVRSPDDL